MKIKELYESAGQNVYHVTFDKHLPSITKGGIKPLQTSNWAKASGDEGTRYNEEGGIFAFADPVDAFKWAFRQEYEFKEPVSIVRLRRGSNWEKDPSGDITLQMGQGDALRSMSAVSPSDIEGVYSFKELGVPGNGVSQAEWIQNSVNTISGQVTEAPAKKAAPKKKTAAQIKAGKEKIRFAVQTGTIDKKSAWAVKNILKGVIEKYATGPDWEIHSQYMDTGLYYIGDDLEIANHVGREIIGALYGWFQDGSKKSITKLKRDEDSNTMTFTAMPTPDKWGDRKPPQLSFVLHKNIKKGSPVIGIHLNVAR